MKLSRKNKLLFSGIFLALVVCYRFAISNTLDYYREYREQKELVNNNLSSADLLQNLIEREKQLNTVLDKYNAVSDDSFQNNLLKEITVLSDQYKLKITDFKEPHAFTMEDTSTKSYVFSVEGSFNGTLLLINKLENIPSLGFIKHINFIKKRNYRNNSYYLVTEILLQKTETVKSN
ncbi:general secretion pathway protein [Flavobacterium beibuense]|uniref:Putative bacterial general secretion pathway protein n=1 Tax=Flavobacterium beibuense TaxID=657326 RepID=A0A444W8D1_9FLAO|nr:general secretion pathway protein [Flavobacterium beibuense]RYJ42043.1 putative bacterial general secretion pathway protein [Flavobacterium beibuense]